MSSPNFDRKRGLQDVKKQEKSNVMMNIAHKWVLFIQKTVDL